MARSYLNWKLCSFSLLFILLLPFAAAQAKEGAPFLNIQSLTTPAGIPVWYLVDHSQPIVALSFGFKDAGTAHDPKEKQGLAQMVASTLDEGAGPYDSRAFQEKLQNLAISLSFSASRDDFFGTVKTLKSSQDEAFSLLHQALIAPRFTDEATARMRRAHQSRLMDNKTDPDWQAARLLNDRLFEGTPYALNSGGTFAGLGAVSRADLLAFQKRFLTRSRLRVAIVGDMDPNTLGAVVDGMFGDLPAGEAAPAAAAPSAPRIPLQNAGATFLFRKDIPQTILIRALPAPDRDDPDEPAFAVMNSIFGGGGFGSRLMDSIREQAGLTYGIYSGPMHLARADYLAIRTSTKNDQAARLSGMIEEEMAKIAAASVTAEELSAAKGFMLGSMASALTSTDKIADVILGLMIEGRPIDDLDQRRAALAATTAKDVQQAAQKWLDPKRSMTVLVGTPQGLSNVTVIKTLPGVEK